VSRLLAIATTCDISRDHAQNTRNHQEMLDKLNAEISADGWAGVSIFDFYIRNGCAVIQIEPGEEALTLEYLRRFKEERRTASTHTQQEPEQRALFN
jgi:hypothetical protein